MTIRSALAALLLLSNLAGATPASATDANSGTLRDGPLKLVVPYPPGGTVDIVGRQFAQALAARLGTTVVVDNRPGAGTMLGASAVAKAKPDGYTLLIAPNTTLTVLPLLQPKLPYQQDALDGLGLIGLSQFVITANAKFPANTLSELVALARKEPNKHTFGSFGNGTTTHLAGEQLNQQAGIKLLHVPYKGAAPALQDLLGGNLSIMVDAVPAAAVQVRAGSIKALAVTGRSRSELLPDVPTVAEAGYPAYQMDGWIGLVAPAGLPPQARQALVRAVNDIAGDPVFQKSMRSVGMEPLPKPAPTLDTLIREELQRHRQIIEKANIKMD